MQRVLRSTLAVLGMAVATVAARPVQAQVAYDGGLPTNEFGLFMIGNRIAQGFTLGSTTEFNGVRFWATTVFPGDIGYTGTISYALYESNGSVPGALLFGGTTSVTGSAYALNIVNGSFDSYQYDFGVGNRSLGSGSYFLELFGVAASFMSWERTGDRPNDPTITTPDFSTAQNYGDVAFQLRTDGPAVVPEPASAALLAAGLLLLGVGPARRRLRQG